MTARRLVYVDTSLLVKLYVEEPDSRDAAALLDDVAIATSAISTIELTAAFHAARRARRLSNAQLRVAVRQLSLDAEGWYLLDVTPAVIRHARTVVADHALRSIDALHCASALILGEAVAKPPAFATADRRQRAAAAALGFDFLGDL